MQQEVRCDKKSGSDSDMFLLMAQDSMQKWNKDFIW